MPAQKYFKLIFLIVFYQIACGTVSANPIAGIFDPNCFVVHGDCPNENVTFWLYTNATRDSPLLLDPLNLNPWDFQPRRPLKFLIHGYTGYRDFAPSSFIRPVLLDVEDVYVISIDYGPLVREPCYVAGVYNLPLVSKCLAQLINNLVDLSIVENDDIHVIGYSLGGQVAGQTANYVKRKLRRITGLDPAKPLFYPSRDEYVLDKNDADFVDVIHTDTAARGMLHSMGHVDFYPNLGPFQPGCLDEPGDPGSCNHDRAPKYYAESIHNSTEFWAYSCPSWFHYFMGLCYENTNDARMGYHVNEDAKGKFFLKTASTSPYALGRVVNKLKIAREFNKALMYYNISHVDDGHFEPLLRNVFLHESEQELNVITPEDEIEEEED